MCIYMDQSLRELAHECFDYEYYEHPDRNSFKYKQLKDGTIMCVHHIGNGQFRCRVAPGNDEDLMLATLVEHMDDIYMTTKFQYPLAPPYTLDEIKVFERENQTTLPALLRHYLLKISRETACNSYRITIDLNTRGLTHNNVVTPCVVSDGMIEETYEWVNDCKIELEGTLEFSTSGCAFMTYVIVKGNGYGNVLSYNGNDVYFIDPLWKCLLMPKYWSKPQ